ncbi:MAG: hypothetical protein Q4E47_03120 [Candidatus Saccharibacteria bacterium]|nr:hypothetical protein [Candidatus Saccharibacteria bacterium]
MQNNQPYQQIPGQPAQPIPAQAVQPAYQQPAQSTYQQPAAPVQAPAPSPIKIQNPMAPDAPVTQLPDAKNATQTTLLLSEIRDSLVIMKDGSFRAVVACKSINFDLMSETEREGVEYSYQSFLNSLTFTTQILIRSQRVDIGPYLERLTEIRRNNDNMLLGVLMDDYINFIDILSQEANIMDKSFFIIIPYYTSPEAEKMLNQPKNIFSGIFSTKTPEVTRIDRATYDKATSEINNRVESIISGLFQIGIHSVRLNTKELSELYYNFNNPDTAVREPFIDFSKMATTYVRKAPNPNAQPAAPTLQAPGANYQGGQNA